MRSMYCIVTQVLTSRMMSIIVFYLYIYIKGAYMYVIKAKMDYNSYKDYIILHVHLH